MGSLQRELARLAPESPPSAVSHGTDCRTSVEGSASLFLDVSSHSLRKSEDYPLTVACISAKWVGYWLERGWLGRCQEPKSKVPASVGGLHGASVRSAAKGSPVRQCRALSRTFLGAPAGSAGRRVGYMGFLIASAQ